jgi:hypothetical protein
LSKIKTINIIEMKVSEFDNTTKPQHEVKLPVSKSVCPKCEGKGWYFVNEWIGKLQGRKDCYCKGKLPS